MSRRWRLLAAAAVLSANACGRAKHDAPDPTATKPARTAVAATPTASPDRLQPGRWTATPSVSSLDLPGVPPEQVDRMKAALAMRLVPRTYCLTAEDAGRPPMDLFTNDRSGECRVERMTMAAGRVDGAMVCRRPSRTQPSVTTAMQMTVAGTFTPTDFGFDLTMSYVVPGRPDGSAHMTLIGHRTGACI